MDAISNLVFENKERLPNGFDVEFIVPVGEFGVVPVGVVGLQAQGPVSYEYAVGPVGPGLGDGLGAHAVGQLNGHEGLLLAEFHHAGYEGAGDGDDNHHRQHSPRR